MTWYAWLMVGFMVFSAGASLRATGKPRKPITPEGAALAALVAWMYVLGIVSLALH